MKIYIKGYIDLATKDNFIHCMFANRQAIFFQTGCPRPTFVSPGL